MKKTTATITCNNVYNHGATLQQYALLAYLEAIDYDAFSINYKPPYLSNHFKFTSVGSPFFSKNIFLKLIYIFLKFPGRIIALKRKKSFDTFEEKWIKKTSNIYTSNSELKQNPPVADAYICGSDQIWNSFFQNGKDPAFYLNFVPQGKKKISYAASFAIDELAEEVKPLVRDSVATFDSVSVRETSGVRILNELGIENAVQVLDPVFLLDKGHWQKLILPIKDKFIFIYDCDSNPIIKKVALQLKKENGYLIYTTDKNIRYADKNFYYQGPEIFLSLVAQSQINLTNSFHATAFSLIFQKEFVVVNRFEKINTRMRDLLELVGIKNHLVSTLEEAISLPKVDYLTVSNLLKQQINKSKEFLINALK